MRATWDCRAVAEVQPGINLVVARDAIDRATHEREMELSLREKETLIKEIHHRVKNNLQLIENMLAIQGMQTEGSETSEALSAAMEKGVTLHIDLAVPCGLILNNHVSNSAKHAFPHHRTGTIRISMRRHDEKVVLTVCDNGVGIQDTDVEAYDSVGMMLIRSLIAKLEGTILLESDEGTTVTIRFVPRRWVRTAQGGGASRPWQR